jgi:hypothetical protein
MFLIQKFILALQAIFIVVKIANTTQYSWVEIFIPLYILGAGYILFFALFGKIVWNMLRDAGIGRVFK